MLKQKRLKNRGDKCPDGLCPVGVDAIREIILTPQEKRAVYFRLKDQIFKQKQLLQEIPLF